MLVAELIDRKKNERRCSLPTNRVELNLTEGESILVEQDVIES